MENIKLVICMFVSILISGCATPVSPTKSLESIFPDEKWIILARPNTAWKPGDVINVMSVNFKNGDPQVEANFAEDCLPDNLWENRKGMGGSMSLIGKYEYDFDISGTIKLEKIEIAEAAISPATTGNKTIKINKYEELSAKSGKIDIWLQTETNGKINFLNLNLPCQKYLISPEYRIIGDTFNIIDGEIYSSTKFGDEKKPLFQIKDADWLKKLIDINSNFNATALREGKIVITDELPPMVIAIRERDFSRMLYQNSNVSGAFGFADTPPPSRPMLKELMKKNKMTVEK